MASRKILGLIGGMGPDASGRMLNRLTELTPAATDQQHLEIHLHSNTGVPDRTAGILGLGPDPLPELSRSVKIMDDLGVDLIAFACMTSHYFLPRLQEISRARIIDGVGETAAWCRLHHPDVRKVGVLATSGSLKTGIYQKALQDHDLEPVLLDADDQENLFMAAVYADWGIKAGHLDEKPRQHLLAAIDKLKAAGAQAVVAGCTEVPLVLSADDIDLPFLDTIDIMCHAVIRECWVA
jgi:aspartate racemase